jgi:hypothetical protein
MELELSVECVRSSIFKLLFQSLQHVCVACVCVISILLSLAVILVRFNQRACAPDGKGFCSLIEPCQYHVAITGVYEAFLFPFDFCIGYW